MVMPSSTWAAPKCNTKLCNGWGILGSWYEKLVSPPEIKQRGAWSRGPLLKVMLLKNNPILEAGKEVVYFGWMGCPKEVVLTIDINGEKSWKTPPIKSDFVAITKADVEFKVGNVYDFTISCGDKKESHELKVVNNVLDVLDRFSEGEKQELDKILNKFGSSLDKKVARTIWLAKKDRRYMLEAYQYVVEAYRKTDSKEFKVFKEGLEAGTLP
jgi:hypothetical protein